MDITQTSVQQATTSDPPVASDPFATLTEVEKTIIVTALHAYHGATLRESDDRGLTRARRQELFAMAVDAGALGFRLEAALEPVGDLEAS